MSIILSSPQWIAVDLNTVNQKIETFEKTQKWKISWYDTASKVAMFITVASFLVPMSTMTLLNQPAWVLWGLGLPLSLFSGIIFANLMGKFNQSAETLRCIHRADLFLRQMLREHSYKVLLPLGDWVLPDFDERMRSDEIIEDKLEISHKQSAEEMNRLIGVSSSNDGRACVDLELSTWVKILAADRLAQKGELDWSKIKEDVANAKKALREGGSTEEFNRKIEEAKKAAINLVPNEEVNFSHIPALTPREQIHHLLDFYAYVCQQFHELNTLHEEGLSYYGERHPNWEEYLNALNRTQEAIFPCISIGLSEYRERHLDEGENLNLSRILEATQSHTVTQIDDIFEQSEEIRTTLLSQVDRAYRLKRELKTWIQNHPTNRIVRYQHKLEAIKQKIIGEDESIEHWVEREHCFLPGEATIKLLKFDIDTRAVLRSDSRTQILERKRNMQEAWSQAESVFNILQRSLQAFVQSHEEIEEAIPAAASPRTSESDLSDVEESLESDFSDTEEGSEVSDEEIGRSAANIEHECIDTSEIEAEMEGIALRGRLQTCEAMNLNLQRAIEAAQQSHRVNETQSLASAKEALDRFELETIATLEKAILIDVGEPSHSRRFFKMLFRAMPPKPFDPVEAPIDPPILQHRSIVQIQTNHMLQSVDRSIKRTAMVPKICVTAFFVADVVLQILACTAFALSQQWIIIGMLGGTLSLFGLQLYINYRLKMLHEEKQRLKLRPILRNLPLMKQTSGAHPGLERVKQVQFMYDLEGVSETWGHVLKKGDRHLPSENKSSFLNLAEKGSEIAKRALKKEKLKLSTVIRSVADPEPYEERLREINEVLSSRPRRRPSRRREPTEYENLLKSRDEAVQKRNTLDRALELVSMMLQTRDVRLLQGMMGEVQRDREIQQLLEEREDLDSQRLRETLKEDLEAKMIEIRGLTDQIETMRRQMISQRDSNHSEPASESSSPELSPSALPTHVSSSV